MIKDLHESVIAKLQSSAKRKGCAIGKVYRMPHKDTNVIDRRTVTEITINVTFCIFILTSLLNIKLWYALDATDYYSLDIIYRFERYERIKSLDFRNIFKFNNLESWPDYFGMYLILYASTKTKISALQYPVRRKKKFFGFK